MTEQYETVLLEKADGLGTIRLNRPKALNAINQQMLADMDAALDNLELDETIRVIAITGTGRAFSAGRDLKEIGTDAHRSAADVWARLTTIGKPVVAVVNGLCYTGALSMLLACDLVIAAESAVFADTHAKFGMFHGGGTTQRLRDLVGPRRAKELLFTCEPIDAAEAWRIGLVNRVVPAERLDQAASELAESIARNNAAAMASMKYLMNVGLEWGTSVGLELETREYKRQRREKADELRAGTDSFFTGGAREGA